MDRDYDLFQVLADGSLVWRETVAGREAAIKKLEQLAQLESCEFQLLQLPEKTIIATMNAPKAAGPKP